MDLKKYDNKALFKILSNKEKEISFLKSLCSQIEKLEQNKRAYSELEKKTELDISSINVKNHENIEQLKHLILCYINER